MPNIVIVHTDDTGRYIGPYGHAVDTPRLRSLAESGVTFRSAYCAGPTCSPSRGAMLTGQSPHSNGLIGLAHRGFSMDDYDRHLAGFLADRGLESVLVGQQHEVEDDDPGSVLGYDRVLSTDPDAVRDLPVDHSHTRRDLASATAAAEYIQEESDEPYFLSVGLYNTHKGFPMDQDSVDPDYVRTADPIPDRADFREEMAAYYAAVEYVDEFVGIVSDALRDTGQLADTLFVFTTDHGVALPHMKCTLFEDGTGISLIARFPDGTGASRGVAEDALVSNIDLFPTICDLLDTDRPDWLEGSSVLPLVSGTVDSVRDEVFGEVTYHAAYEPKRCICTQDYTYIRRYDDGEGVDDWHPDGRVPYIPANTDDGEAKQALVEDLIERGRPREALYDRRLDPNERDDLADVAEYSDVRENLATRLDAWMRETDDPLLDGPVPKPNGAKVDRRDVLQPGGDEAEEQNAR